ncbi:MAG TPA: transporter substrate-binding domain-containing protein [Stellaceae bacterium]|nr:transporter substrate-binding domain-containing protein [Stellaceae bacterium]
MMRALLALGLLQAALGPVAAASPPSAEARIQLAPTGKLRVAILTYDPALGSREASGAPGGVEGDLARSLADAIGVPLQTIFYDLPQGFAQSVGSLAWDVAFAGREVPGRVDFAATILLVEHELLLAPGRNFQDLADVDRDKVRVGVTMGTVDEPFLGQRLHKAFIFRVLVGTDAASTTLRTSGADVFAGSVPFLSKVAAGVPGSRMLGPPYALVPVMATVAPGRTAARAYIADFIREAKTSGFIQQSINRAQLPGVSVAPP